jgi:hypothetical protein
MYSHMSENLGEYQGTEGEASRLFAYPKILNRAADTYAEASRGFWVVTWMPIEYNNPGPYCAPQVIEWQCVTLFGSDGNVLAADTATEPGLDSWNGPYWRRSTSGTPNTIAAQGLNSLILTPTPSYASTVANYIDLVLGTASVVDSADNTQTVSTMSSAARPFVNAVAPAGDVNLLLNIPKTPVVTGFNPGWYRIVSVAGGVATLGTLAGVNGSVGGVAVLSSGGLWIEGPGVPGDGTWDNLTDSCPLPDRYHMGIVDEASRLRARRPGANIPDNIYARIKADADDSMGKIERSARNVTQASRVPAMVDGFNSGPWDNIYGNPLGW